MSDNTVPNLSECADELAQSLNTNNVIDNSAQEKSNTISQEECDDFDTNLCQPLDAFSNSIQPPMLQRSASSAVHAPPMLQRSASSAVHAPPMLQRIASSVVQSYLECGGSEHFTGFECGADTSTRNRSNSVVDDSDDHDTSDDPSNPLNIFFFGTPHSVVRSGSGTFPCLANLTDDKSQQTCEENTRGL